MNIEIVEAVQTRLLDLGWYAGKVDGAAGPRTEAAVVDFKRAIGFNPRPFVGIETLAALFAPNAKRAVKDVALPWMAIAQSKLKLHERNDYAVLAAFLRSDGFTLGDPRKLPWCGDFVETCIRVGLSEETIPTNPYLARNWMKFGVATTPRLGAVLVFWRGSKAGTSGHVGFYVGEDADAYYVLGGNQSDAVTITRIAKNRLLGARWAVGNSTHTLPARMNAGGALSTNEA